MDNKIITEQMQDLYDLLNTIYWNDAPGENECSDEENIMFIKMRDLIEAIEAVYKEG